MESGDKVVTYFVKENGAIVLRSYPPGARPSNFYLIAPVGIIEGDDDAVTIVEKGKIEVDWEKIRVKREAQDWNEQSFFNRILGRIRG